MFALKFHILRCSSVKAALNGIFRSSEWGPAPQMSQFTPIMSGMWFFSIIFFHLNPVMCLSTSVTVCKLECSYMASSGVSPLDGRGSQVHPIFARCSGIKAETHTVLGADSSGSKQPCAKCWSKSDELILRRYRLQYG